jgi:hypothetical protein
MITEPPVYFRAIADKKTAGAVHPSRRALVSRCWLKSRRRDEDLPVLRVAGMIHDFDGVLFPRPDSMSGDRANEDAITGGAMKYIRLSDFPAALLT